IELAEIPVRLMKKSQTKEIVRAHTRSRGPIDHRLPAGFTPTNLASREQACIELLPGSRIHRTAIDLLDRTHLRRRQAIRPIGSFAQKLLRVEVAPGRIADDSVLCSIQRVACFERCVL